MTQPCAVLRDCTTYSKACCELVAAGGGAAALLRVLRSCNRSAPHVAFLHSALAVLAALARHESTAGALLEADSCVAALSEQLQLFREKQASPSSGAHVPPPWYLLLPEATWTLALRAGCVLRSAFHR